MSGVSFRKLQMRLKIMHPIISHPSLFYRLRQTDFRVEFALYWLMRLIKWLYCDKDSLKKCPRESILVFDSLTLARSLSWGTLKLNELCFSKSLSLNLGTDLWGYMMARPTLLARMEKTLFKLPISCRHPIYHLSTSGHEALGKGMGHVKNNLRSLIQPDQ